MLEAAKEHWGRDVAITLMEMLPPAGWGDVATRQQLEAMESRLTVTFDAKLAVLGSRFEATAASSHRQLMQWTVGMMIAMTGIFATVVGILR